ncbi:RDD family protein [Pseudonocardiaceae bacterium YIM PH 21723]|nr:RDD family protein [Pseudonocardiaceae bacterium YIM PH 21723]
MSQIITGDAVPLELREARLASRGVAYALDLMIVVIGFIIGLILFVGLMPERDLSLAQTLTLVYLIAMLVGLPTLVETLSSGRSLGKLIMGLRVVRDDGGPIRFRHALVRSLSGFFVDFWALGLFGAVAAITSLISPRGKRVGDYLAGTVVIRVRAPRAGHPGWITMPDGYAEWAAGLNVRVVPDDLALSVRQFLGRAHELTLSARTSLGRRLAGEVAAHLGIGPDPSMHPELYLAAVLAERRRRAEL